jgi:hypothetical protein
LACRGGTRSSTSARTGKMPRLILDSLRQMTIQPQYTLHYGVKFVNKETLRPGRLVGHRYRLPQSDAALLVLVQHLDFLVACIASFSRYTTRSLRISSPRPRFPYQTRSLSKELICPACFSQEQPYTTCERVYTFTTPVEKPCRLHCWTGT